MFFSKLYKWFPYLALFLLWLAIVYTNYIPATLLTGWDNLHPEFNHLLNIKRAFSSFWIPNFGVGVLGGMGHAADLPRQILLFALSGVISMDILRYGWTFAMLLLGSFGAYILFSSISNRFAGFVGALFYVCNMATVQVFYVPFETFVSFYGFLPLLLYFPLQYLDKPSFRRLRNVALIGLAATPAFYVQTLFVVYLVVLGIFLVATFFKKGLKKRIVSITKLILTIATINAFWFLPVMYFSITQAPIVGSSKINSIATPDTKYMNQGAGSLAEISLLKGFWFEYFDATANASRFDYLLPVWRDHLSQIHITQIGYALFGFISAGYLLGLFRAHKSPTVIPAFIVCIFSMVMLTGGSGPFGFVFAFMSDHIPLFGQIFRSVFTKWSLVTALFYAWGLTLFIFFVSQFLKKWTIFIVGAFTVLLLTFISPVFSGALISDTMQLRMPNEYSQLFTFFKTQPKDRRIAFLPIHSFWGWNFYSWGYRGSGFLWYGIEQPIMDRAFDVWSPENESFYFESFSAISKLDSEALNRTFQKYDISYLLVDESVVTPGVKNNTLGVSQELLDKLLAKKVWSSGFLSVYEVGDGGLASVINNPVRTSTDMTGAIKDLQFTTYKDTVYDPLSTHSYPFSFLLHERVKNISYHTDFRGIRSVQIAAVVKEPSNLFIPPLDDDSLSSVATISYIDSLIKVQFAQPLSLGVNGIAIDSPEFIQPLFLTVPPRNEKLSIEIGGKIVEISEGQEKIVQGIILGKDKPLKIAVYALDHEQQLKTVNSLLNQKFNTCWQREEAEVSISQTIIDGILNFKLRDAVACASAKIGTYPGDMLATISVPFMSPNGGRPDFCVVEEGTNVCLHDEVFYHSFTNTDWDQVSRQVLFKGGKNYWMILNARPSDASGVELEINYKVPEVSVAPRILEVTFKPELWGAIWRKQEIHVPSGNLEVQIASTVLPLDLTMIGQPAGANCDLFKRGEIKKTIGINIEYQASHFASVCDIALTQNIVQTAEYLLRIQGENNKGRSLKLYMYNQNQMKTSLEVLADPGSFDSTYYLSDAAAPSKDYSVTVETRSFGKNQISRNTLNNVVFYELPITWIANWQLGNSEIDSEKQLERINISSTSVNPALHILYPNTKGNIVVLSQGFDKGWIGFQKNKILKHVLVNSWANGWEIQDSNTKVIVFYVPQILQWFAFLCLPLTFILLLIKSTILRKG